jgi:MATE family multidrug resistance protein
VQKYFIEARQLLALAIPVILAQVAQTSMGFVDTVMAGGYSATDMAAVAIGTSIWLPAILFGHGLLLALTPVIAQLNGSGRRDRIAHQVRQGFWLAGFVSLLVMVVLWNAGYIISSMHNIDPALAEKAVGYLRALLWGAPGYLFFQVARNQCEGLAKTGDGDGFIGLLVNIPVNYIFIYGHFGMPELGGIGCGVATASVYWVMFFCMISWVRRARSMRDIRSDEGFSGPDFGVLKRLVQLGCRLRWRCFSKSLCLRSLRCWFLRWDCGRRGPSDSPELQFADVRFTSLAGGSGHHPRRLPSWAGFDPRCAGFCQNRGWRWRLHGRDHGDFHHPDA